MKRCHSEPAFGAPGRETGVPDTRPSARAYARALKGSRVCRGGEAPRQENVGADVPLFGGRGIPPRFWLRGTFSRRVAQPLGFAAGFVAQVVPAALGARAPSLKHAGRPEAFSRRVAQPLLAVHPGRIGAPRHASGPKLIGSSSRKSAPTGCGFSGMTKLRVLAYRRGIRSFVFVAPAFRPASGAH